MSEKYYVRDPLLIAVTTEGSTLLIGRTLRLGVDSADAGEVSSFLQKIVKPLSEKDFKAVVSEYPPAFAGFVDEMVSRKLILSGERESVLSEAGRFAGAPHQGPAFCKNLVVGICGTIGSIWTLSYLTRLKSSGFCEDIEVMLTDSALKFVGRAGFEAFGFRTWTNHFEASPDVRVPHINLADAADMILIPCASAHTVSRIAQGECSDLISLTVAATKAPVVVAPSMNQNMWENKAIRRNVDQLRKDGIYVIEPNLTYESATYGTGAEMTYGGTSLLGEPEAGRALREILGLHKVLHA